MESRPMSHSLADFFASLAGPLVTSCVVTIVGLGFYFYSQRNLKRHQLLDKPALAEMNITSDVVQGGLSGLLSLYGLGTTLVWAAAGAFHLRYADEDAGDQLDAGLFFYIWPDSAPGLVGLAMVLASLLFTIGTAFSTRWFASVAELKLDAGAWMNSMAMQTTTPHPPATNIDSEPTSVPLAAEQRTDPVTFSELLEALDSQLKEAIEEAHGLRTQLEETKSKVTTLEVEVEQKDVLIEEIEASKSSLSQRLSDREQRGQAEEKNLSLTDSVMVGDSIMGGMKIDKQVNNDPDAIARAVIAAYRAGRKDGP